MKQGEELRLCYVLVIADVRKPVHCRKRTFYSEPDHSIDELDFTPLCLLVVLASQLANCAFNRWPLLMFVICCKLNLIAYDITFQVLNNQSYKCGQWDAM